MEAKAVAKYIGLSPRKTRIPVDIVRGMDVTNALNVLKYMQKGAALQVMKVVESAFANATNNYKMNSSSLYISEIKVDNGPTQRRIYFKGKGGYRFLKKPTAHITVIVSDLISEDRSDVKSKLKVRTSLIKKGKNISSEDKNKKVVKVEETLTKDGKSE